MLKFKLSLCLLGAALFAGAAAPLADGSATAVWDPSNRFAGWGAAKRLTLTNTGELLKLDILGKDSSIAIQNLAIDPTRVNTVTIEYRATGIPAATTGQLFFANAGQRSFVGTQYWRFFNLKSDGEWHTLKLTADKKTLAYGLESWTSCGTIDKLRLDMVDQFPGVLEIRSIRFSASEPQAAPAPAPAAPKGSATVVWDKNNRFAGWGAAKNLTLTNTGELLKLDILDKDSSIAIQNLAIDPTRVNTVTIEYRATGLPAATTGQLFFANAGQRSFVGTQYWRFFNLKSDGEWHTLKLIADKKTLAYGLESWTSCGTIDKLRLDMVDQFPGVLEIRSIRFDHEVPPPPLFGALPEWPPVTPNLPRVKLARAKFATPYWSGYMIRSPGDTSENLAAGRNKFAFRRIFFAPDQVAEAVIQAAVDDQFELYLNGVRVLSSTRPDGWKFPQVAVVTRHLKPGARNVISGFYRNLGGPGGVLAELTMLTAGGKTVTVASDGEFRTAIADGDAYHAADFQDGDWAPMLLQSPPPAAPWTQKLAFRDITPHLALNLEALELPAAGAAGESLPLRLRGVGTAPAPGTAILLKLFAADGEVVAESVVAVTAEALRAGTASGPWEVTLPLSLPRYYSGQRMRVEVGFADGGDRRSGQFEYRAAPVDRLPAVTAAVKVRYDGQPEFLLNGQATYPLIGNAYRKFAATNFQQVPMTMRTIWCRDIGWWAGPDDFRYSVLDKRFEELLTADPDSPVLLFIGLDMPNWWGEANPGELMRFNDGSTWRYGLAPVSFASDKYREAALMMLEKLIGYCRQAPYGNRIAGYVLCAGYSCEMQNWACHDAARLQKLSDYSEPFRRQFAAFLKAEYPALAEAEPTLPDFAARTRKSGDIFLAPEQQLRNIAVNEYLSRSIADFIAAIAPAARALAGAEKVLGVYYGYTLEYPNLNWALQLSGHNALARVLKIKELDLLLSPPSYGVRAIGDCGEDMKPFASIRAAGKLAVVDDDSRTDTIIFSDFFQTVTRQQTRDVLRRNFGRTLSRMEPLCLYALVGSEEFSAPETVADLRRFRQIAQFAVANRSVPNAEIAFVVSERAHLVMALDKNPAAQGARQWYGPGGKVSSAPRMVRAAVGESIYYQRSRLAEIGAPVDYILAEDLESVIDRPYKLWIFPNAYNPDAKFVAAIEKLKRRPVTLLWLRAPGVFYENRPDDGAIAARLTGMKPTRLARPAEAIMTMNDGTRVGNFGATAPLFSVTPAARVQKLAVYAGLPGTIAAARCEDGAAQSVFYGVDGVRPAFFRQLAAAAGAHIYSESDDILYANSDFITFHAVTPGRKKIRLPKKADAVDVFSRETVAVGVTEFEFDARLHETRIFFIGDRHKLPR